MSNPGAEGIRAAKADAAAMRQAKASESSALVDGLQKEVTNLKRRYSAELENLQSRAAAADAKLTQGSVSTHDAFNLSACCVNLAELAGKIEQTENCIRWAQEAK